MTEYHPSDILIYLLYTNVAREIPKEVHPTMLEYTQRHIRQSLTATMADLRQRLGTGTLADGSPKRVSVMDRDCRMTTSFLQDMKKRVDLQASAEWHKGEFQQRLGEEIMVWFLHNREAAESHGLRMGTRGGLYLVAKPARDEDGIDNLGCA